VSKSRLEAFSDGVIAIIIIRSEGLCPSDSPTRSLAGTPEFPAPLPWLTRRGSFAMLSGGVR
jgi:hypothetical protein